MVFGTWLGLGSRAGSCGGRLGAWVSLVTCGVRYFFSVWFGLGLGLVLGLVTLVLGGCTLGLTGLVRWLLGGGWCSLGLLGGWVVFFLGTLGLRTGLGGVFWLLGFVCGGLGGDLGLLILGGGGLGVLELNFMINWCIRLGFWSRFAPLGMVGLLSSSFGLWFGSSLVFLTSFFTVGFFIIPGFSSFLRSEDLFPTRCSGFKFRPNWAPE